MTAAAIPAPTQQPMHLASAGFGVAMTAAARLAAATMAVVVFCMTWSSGLFPYQCILEPKVPSGHHAGGAFFSHLTSRNLAHYCNECGNRWLGKVSRRRSAPDFSLFAAATRAPQLPARQVPPARARR